MRYRYASARFVAAAVFAAVLVVGAGTRTALAQVPLTSGYSDSYRVSDYLGAPGNYGMS